jgi:hypothetical protein
LKSIFFLFLGLTIIAFGMMRYHQFQFESETGLKFNVMEFELPGSEEKLNELIKAWSEPEKKEFVLKQLRLDYFFMSTLFPLILILCFWARKNFRILEMKNHAPNKFSIPKNMLLVLGILQVFALGFDISENLRLTNWINQGYAGNMVFFETLVKLKFVFAAAGFLSALFFLFFERIAYRYSKK